MELVLPSAPYEEWTDAQPRSPWTQPSLAAPTPFVTPQRSEAKPPSAKPKKPLEDEFEGDEIFEKDDETAPRFGVDQHHLSENAIRQRAKRMFTRRVDGSLRVSETIFNEWKSKGKARKNLEQIFKSVGYDPDPCFVFRTF